MSYLLPHLGSGWAVDQAIVTEEKRVVVIRWGHTSDPKCMQQDEILAKVAEKLRNFAVIYLVDTREVSDFNVMYELHDAQPHLMWFFRGKHIMVDAHTGNNNYITDILDKQDFIDITEVVYRGARKGLGLVVSPVDLSTKKRY